MIPLAVPDITGNEGAYLQDCVRTQFVSSVGPYVGRFEQAVAAATGAAGAVATSAGTTALHLALTALGVGRDDLVILPAFTFIASANAISHCGAQPWLVDIDPASWTLDVPRLAAVLAADCEHRHGRLIHTPSGRRVAAILPVYTLGTPPDMTPLRQLARDYRLPIVADAAAALGASYRGEPLAALADLTCLSFNGNKTVTSGGGGMVLGQDEELLARVRHLSVQARVGSDYTHDAVGFNYRMTNVEAAIGCAQMERLDAFLAAKRRIRQRYDAAFAGLPGTGPFPQPTWADSACWFSGLVLDRNRTPDVPALCAALRAQGVEARPFWKPVHLQPPYRQAPTADLHQTDALWSRILTLPCSTNLSTDEQDHVIAATKTALHPTPTPP